MYSNGDILSFMDLLDLDEEIIDLRANNLMEKSTFTNQHLNNFIHLLQYKHLINIREKSECDNEVEYQFIGKLIQKIDEDNVDVVCKIITTVLSLSQSTIIYKSEHLIQQVLAEIYLTTPNIRTVDLELEKLKKTLLQLKICGSILNAVREINVKLSLPFLNTSLEYLICCKDEKLLIYFLTNTVPQFFAAVVGYNILDRIWKFIQELEDDKARDALRVICSLSNYYLPVEVTENITIESNIISHSKFWDLILLGLLSEDTFARKQSIYLMKRAVDYIMNSNKNVNVSSKSTFTWDHKNKMMLKKMWDNFFILLDSLDEKQSNIVLPSLKLLDNVKDIGCCWINCAFRIGLKHDNTQVRLRCLHYHLQYGIHSKFEAVTILEALNDIVLYDNVHESKSLKDKLNDCIQNGSTLIAIMKALPCIKWSPVPLYHLTNIFTNFKGPLRLEDQMVLIDLISYLSKIPCNNVIIRKSIHVNLAHLIGNCCKDLDWKKYITIYSYLQMDVFTMCRKHKNPFDELIEKHIVILEKDINEVLEFISLSHTNIDFALLYFEKNHDTHLLKFLDDMILRVQDVSRRQYSYKLECIKDAIFVANFYKKSLQMHGISRQKCEINSRAPGALKTLLEYTLSLFTSDTNLDVDYIKFLYENLDYMGTEIRVDEQETILQIFKTAMLFLHDNETCIDKKILSVFVISNCLKSVDTKININESLDLNTFIYTLLNIKFNDTNKENTGRLRNIFYEKSCEIVNTALNSNKLQTNYILNFIDLVLESGGYGCLKWILKITNRILTIILDEKDLKFDMVKFLNRIWKEIEEIKSNSQYTVCMKEFVIIITNDTLLRNSLYNNIVLLYCNNIIRYANVKNMPLYLLVDQLCKTKISQYSHMVYILSEILLQPITPRKENRIIERVLLEILQNPMYGVDKDCIFFNSHIQLLAVSILSNITEPDVLDMLSSFMIKKIEELFKNKQRYHSNSQLQRTLQACLQNLLFIILKSRAVNFNSTAVWCMEFLGRIPHQPFERVCLEWYISLYFYLRESILNEETLDQLKSRNVPLSSQFIIMYWTVVHKIKVGTCLAQEYEFVMELLLSNIMGPVFSIRLHAQYLSAKLYEIYQLIKNKLDPPKYEYIVQVINNTLQEVSKAEDKSLMKLLKDYFVQHFDIVDDLIPSSIYWDLPQFADGLSNDIIEKGFFQNIIKKIEDCLEFDVNDKFYDEWKERMKNVDVLRFKATDHIVKTDDDVVETGTIQKKYIPWKSMSDVDVYNIEKKRTKSKLIVVASLIDKLPNLGGMARTSEVFGVETYVVDSVRHLQDKQFQGLSVSAERWVNVEEVRPGQPLKDYLMMKRTEGYSVLAAEQTSTSSKLQHFKFPKKTLLLLGHEKEGVPCDLLPLMDHCVEIPQQGVIRSLNVHVTAAIFIWEYARQNML